MAKVGDSTVENVGVEDHDSVDRQSSVKISSSVGYNVRRHRKSSSYRLPLEHSESHDSFSSIQFGHPLVKIRDLTILDLTGLFDR